MAEAQKRTAIEDIRATALKVATSPGGRAVGRGVRAGLDYAYDPDTLLRAASAIPNPIQFPAAVVQQAADIARFVGGVDMSTTPGAKESKEAPPKRLASFAAADPGTTAQEVSKVAKVAKDNAAAVASEQAIVDTNQFAELRRQLGTFDISDIEARRDRATKLARGNLAPISRKRFDEEIRLRRATALDALQAIDTNRNAVRSADIADRQDTALIAEMYNRIMRSNIDDSTKVQLDFWGKVVNDPVTRNTDQGKYAQAQLLKIMKQLNLDNISEQEAAQGELGFADEGEGFADGGEVLPPGNFPIASDQAPPELPGAINEAPLPLDSGDYVIPVEAMRFYGRKFFQDLINKAEDVG